MLNAATDPLHQFQISRLIPLRINETLDLSITNSVVFMGLAALAVIVCLGAAARGAMIPNRGQVVAEMMYEFIAKMLRSLAGEEGMRFFPYVFTIFVFILACNLIGMFPYAFTVTSHISVTLTLGLMSFLIVLTVGVARSGLGFFSRFVISGVPWALQPILIPIEIVSFFVRPFTLGVRLFGNMLAGHALLKVLAGFVGALGGLGALGVFAAIFPIIGVVAVTALEFLVAGLQAYVFALLTCLYLSEVVQDHHH